MPVVSRGESQIEKLGVPTDEQEAKVLKHGAISVQEPVKKEDEDKRVGFRDAGGTTRWAGTKVA